MRHPGLRTSVGIAGQGHPIEAADTANSYDLTLLLYVAGFIALVEQFEKRNVRIEGRGHVHGIGSIEFIGIPVEEVIAEIFHRGSFLQFL